MDRKLTICKAGSAVLRNQLQARLAVVFAGNAISKYLVIDGCGPELQILCNCNPLQILAQAKFAFSTWTEMETLHRHQVIGRFQQLYAAHPVAEHGNRKTLLFCALFVHEIASVLAEAMEWPD